MRERPRGRRWLRAGLVLVLAASGAAPAWGGAARGQEAQQDPWKVLGVERGAPEARIKFAYRNMVKQYHPDKNPNESAKKKFLEVQEAYELLTDPEKLGKWKQQEAWSRRSQGHNGRGPRMQWRVRFPNHNNYNDNDMHYYAQKEAERKADWHYTGDIPSAHAESITMQTMVSRVFGDEAWVVEVYDSRSKRCREKAEEFDHVASVNSGVARFGRVRFDWLRPLARRMVAHKMRQELQTRHLPLLVVYSPACRSFTCGLVLPGVSQGALERTLAKALRLPSVPTVRVEGLTSLLSTHPMEKTLVVCVLGSAAKKQMPSQAAAGAVALRHGATVALANLEYSRLDKLKSAWPRTTIKPNMVLVFQDGRMDPVEVHRDVQDLARIVAKLPAMLVPQLRRDTVDLFQACTKPAVCVLALGEGARALRDTMVAAKRGERLAFVDDAQRAGYRRMGKNQVRQGWLDARAQRRFLRKLGVHRSGKKGGTRLLAVSVERQRGRRAAKAEAVAVEEYGGEVSELGVLEYLSWVGTAAAGEGAWVATREDPLSSLSGHPDKAWEPWRNMQRSLLMRADAMWAEVWPVIVDNYPVFIPLLCILLIIIFLAALPLILWMLNEDEEKVRAEVAVASGPSRTRVLPLSQATEPKTRGVMLAVLLRPKGRGGESSEGESDEGGSDEGEGAAWERAQAILEALAVSVSREKIQFCTLSAEDQPAWASVASQAAYLALDGYPRADLSEDCPLSEVFPLLVWRPSRTKYANLGYLVAGGREASPGELRGRVERLLEGLEPWLLGEMPPLLEP